MSAICRSTWRSTRRRLTERRRAWCILRMKINAFRDLHFFFWFLSISDTLFFCLLYETKETLLCALEHLQRFTNLSKRAKELDNVIGCFARVLLTRSGIEQATYLICNTVLHLVCQSTGRGKSRLSEGSRRGTSEFCRGDFEARVDRRRRSVSRTGRCSWCLLERWQLSLWKEKAQTILIPFFLFF